MTGPEIVWEVPPTTRAMDRPATVDIAALLRSKPGQWARVVGPVGRQVAESVRISLVQGRVKGVVYGDYEATRRKTDEGYYVWARYVGSPDGDTDRLAGEG